MPTIQPQRKIFVDDTDPNIKYGGGWTTPVFDAENATQLLQLPLYGTLHAITNESTSAIFNLSYTFNGTDVLASLFEANTRSGEMETIAACLVDGQKQNFSKSSSALICRTKHSLAEGNHELLMNFNIPLSGLGKPVLFDYITYTPSGRNTSGGDVVYYPGDPSINVSSDQTTFTPGETLDFDFFGYSLGLYGRFLFADPHIPSNASYTMDDQAPINFIINNTATLTSGSTTTDLVLQTPRYPLGQHHFHFDFLGTNDTVPFNFTQIIVQNSTSHVNLESFPSISTTSTRALASPSLKSQSHKADHLGSAVGVTAAAVVTLVLILCIFFRRRRKRSQVAVEESNDSELAIQPFILPRMLRIGRAKERGGEEQLQGRGRLKPGQSVPASRPAPRVRIMHVDSEDQPNEPDIQTEIVELSPAYRSARQSQTSLNYPVAQPPPLPINEVIHIREKSAT